MKLLLVCLFSLVFVLAGTLSPVKIIERRFGWQSAQLLITRHSSEKFCIHQLREDEGHRSLYWFSIV